MKLMVYMDGEGRYFIAPSGLYLINAQQQRVSPYYGTSAAADHALTIKQREYDAANA